MGERAATALVERVCVHHFGRRIRVAEQFLHFLDQLILSVNSCGHGVGHQQPPSADCLPSAQE